MTTSSRRRASTSWSRSPGSWRRARSSRRSRAWPRSLSPRPVRRGSTWRRPSIRRQSRAWTSTGLKRRLLAERAFARRLVSEDGRTTVLAVRVRDEFYGDAYRKAVVGHVEGVLEVFEGSGIEILVTGNAPTRDRYVEFIRRDTRLFLPAAGALLLVTLLALFRQATWPLLATLALGSSLVFTLAFMRLDGPAGDASDLGDTRSRAARRPFRHDPPPHPLPGRAHRDARARRCPRSRDRRHGPGVPAQQRHHGRGVLRADRDRDPDAGRLRGGRGGRDPRGLCRLADPGPGGAPAAAPAPRRARRRVSQPASRAPVCLDHRSPASRARRLSRHARRTGRRGGPAPARRNPRPGRPPAGTPPAGDPVHRGEAAGGEPPDDARGAPARGRHRLGRGPRPAPGGPALPGRAGQYRRHRRPLELAVRGGLHRHGLARLGRRGLDAGTEGGRQAHAGDSGRGHHGTPLRAGPPVAADRRARVRPRNGGDTSLLGARARLLPADRRGPGEAGGPGLRLPRPARPRQRRVELDDELPSRFCGRQRPRPRRVPILALVPAGDRPEPGPPRPDRRFHGSRGNRSADLDVDRFRHRLRDRHRRHRALPGALPGGAPRGPDRTRGRHSNYGHHGPGDGVPGTRAGRRLLDPHLQPVPAEPRPRLADGGHGRHGSRGRPHPAPGASRACPRRGAPWTFPRKRGALPVRA